MKQPRWNQKLSLHSADITPPPPPTPPTTNKSRSSAQVKTRTDIIIATAVAGNRTPAPDVYSQDEGPAVRHRHLVHLSAQLLLHPLSAHSPQPPHGPRHGGQWDTAVGYRPWHGGQWDTAVGHRPWHGGRWDTAVGHRPWHGGLWDTAVGHRPWHGGQWDTAVGHRPYHGGQWDNAFTVHPENAQVNNHKLHKSVLQRRVISITWIRLHSPPLFCLPYLYIYI